MRLANVPQISSSEAPATPGKVMARSADLQAAHDHLLRAMAEMASATQTPQLGRERYTLARRPLSKASRQRRTVWEEVYPHLSARVGPVDLAKLSRLAAANAELRRASTLHVAQWSVEAIDRDWEGYCYASRTMRWKMMSIVRHERRDLLPMLTGFD